MTRIQVIVNPQAGRGYAGRVAPQIRAHLDALQADYELTLTDGPGHAIELAAQALDDGFDRIVAVGGDGTSHEVVNGMMSRANGNGEPVGTLGWIPAGSGNDCAVMNGAPDDLEAACRTLVDGTERLMDVGTVTVDETETRFFDNAVGIGFDGLVTIEARKHTRVRGMALYLPVVIKTVFLDLHMAPIEVTVDGQTYNYDNIMTVISNGPREGGSFLVAPEAVTTDESMDIVMVRRMKRLELLGLVPRFMSGTHVSDSRVSIVPGKDVLVTSEAPMFFHVDGEVMCESAHRIETRMLPSAIRVIGGDGPVPA